MQSANKPPRFVVIANPDSRPLVLFREALVRSNTPPAHLVPYTDLIAGRVHLADVVQPDDIVRIETPGRDFDVERRLIALGASICDSAHGITAEEALSLEFDKGRIWYPRLWYLGFCEVIRRIEMQLAEAPPHRTMHQPDAIIVMFDKPTCHARLSAHGIAVPEAIGPVNSYDELFDEMRRRDWSRVFIKIANGSSASGVVAYQTNWQRHMATTTAEMVRSNGKLILYNSRRIQNYADWYDIRSLIDELCRHQVHVEQWLPKARFNGRVFDLRVMVIAGRVRHIVVRLSRSPMTNLHLRNDRCDFDAIRDRIPDWDAARQNCEDALACFPGSLYSGVDLLFTPDYQRHAILEMNAFGDLLPGCLCHGRDTYETEILAMLGRLDDTEGDDARPQ